MLGSRPHAVTGTAAARQADRNREWRKVPRRKQPHGHLTPNTVIGPHDPRSPNDESTRPGQKKARNAFARSVCPKTPREPLRSTASFRNDQRSAAVAGRPPGSISGKRHVVDQNPSYSLTAKLENRQPVGQRRAPPPTLPAQFREIDKSLTKNPPPSLTAKLENRRPVDQRRAPPRLSLPNFGKS